MVADFEYGDEFEDFVDMENEVMETDLETLKFSEE